MSSHGAVERGKTFSLEPITMVSMGMQYGVQMQKWAGQHMHATRTNDEATTMVAPVRGGAGAPSKLQVDEGVKSGHQIHPCLVPFTTSPTWTEGSPPPSTLGGGNCAVSAQRPGWPVFPWKDMGRTHGMQTDTSMGSSHHFRTNTREINSCCGSSCGREPGDESF
jgi:hypothetical protein